MRDRLLPPVIALLLALGVTACGGDTSGATPASEAPATTGAEEVTESGDAMVITISGLSFPEAVTVPSGKLVRWVNESSAPHEVQMETHDGAPADVEPVRLGPDQEGELLLESGTWDYFCTIHPSMTGTLVVQP
jgi:plastocyanin